jgi:hypothetical protein
MNALTQFVTASNILAADAAAPPSVGWGAMTMLILFIAGSMCIGVFANMTTQKGGFMKGFFLGNRGLGAWALALTATIQSGGTFMGFPSLVYSHGWIVALWIGSYMVVPITGFGILGKRLAQLSRRTGAITVPDLFRTRPLASIWPVDSHDGFTQNGLHRVLQTKDQRLVSTERDGYFGLF